MEAVARLSCLQYAGQQSQVETLLSCLATRLGISMLKWSRAQRAVTASLQHAPICLHVMSPRKVLWWACYHGALQ